MSVFRKVFGLPLVTVLLVLCVTVPLASARQTTATTLEVDASACTDASDNGACESAYSFLEAQLKADTRDDKDAAQSTLRMMAETGCSIGSGSMCFQQAVGSLTGEYGWVQDKPRGKDLVGQACELDHALSCWVLGTWYEKGTFVEVDREQARALYEKGCVLGAFSGCKSVATYLLQDKVDAAPAAPEGIQALKSRCADMALDGPSCIAVGVAYQRGSDGAELNQTLAWQYWAKACREISYGPACKYYGLAVLRISDAKDPQSSDNLEARRSLQKACELGEMDACEFMIPGADAGALNNGLAMVEAHYRLCLNEPTLAHCERAGDAFQNGALFVKAGDYTITRNKPKATLAWLTACRAFNEHCVEAADLHLVQQDFALPSPNLAIGILESACAKGDEAACARQTEVIAETGGVSGSYIDPMLSDDERFMIAKFDLDSGDLGRGRETLQWLANAGHSDAQLALAIAYEAGLSPTPGGRRVSLFDGGEMKSKLFELTARKGIPEAAMRVAVQKYNENDHEGADSYENAIARAVYLGADGAEAFYRAEIAQNQARIEAQSQAMREMNQRNIEARNNMDRQTVERAWSQYFENRKKEAEAAGGEVCGLVIGQGNSTYRTCMSRAHALKYYRGNF